MVKKGKEFKTSYYASAIVPRDDYITTYDIIPNNIKSFNIF